MEIDNDIKLNTAVTFSEKAEKEIIRKIIDDAYFSKDNIQRNIASYPKAFDYEKDKIILDLMRNLWEYPKTAEIFKVFKELDLALTVIGIKGHFVHQFEVFLFGWFVFKKLLASPCGKNVTDKFGSINNIFFTWMISSTAHDFGYPLQEINKLMDKLSSLYQGLHITKLADQLDELFKYKLIEEEKELNIARLIKTGEEIQIEELVKASLIETLDFDTNTARKVTTALRDKCNHGYVSSLILGKTYLESIYSTTLSTVDETRLRDRLKYATAAIALHAYSYDDSVKIIKKINFDLNPFAYILYIVDNIQEWNRAINPNEDWPIYNLAELNENNEEINITYLLVHDNWDDSRTSKVVDALAEKENKLLLATPPTPSDNLAFHIKFVANNGYEFKPITLRI